MDRSLIIFYVIGVSSVLSISFIIYRIFVQYNFKLINSLMYTSILLSSYMFFAQFLKYNSLHFYVDFSHWAQIFYNVSISWKPASLTVELIVPGSIDYLSVHFVPLIYILAIPFKLLPFSWTIIFMNFILMLSTVIPLYKLAMLEMQKKQFAIFMVILLLWHPTFQYTVLYEFEMLRFSIPIIFWMLYFWERRKTFLYFIFVALAVLVREEVGLTIAMFGFYLIFFEKKRLTGLITLMLGLGAFIIISKLIMPSLRVAISYEHIAASWFSAFSKTPQEALKNIIMNPRIILLTIFHPLKLANVFMFFLPLLFIPFLAPTVLISILANFGVGLISGVITHISYMLYYLSPSIPFIFYAFIKGWPRFLEILNKFMSKLGKNTNANVNSVAMAAVLSGLIVTNIFFGPSPISLQFWFKNIRPAPFRTQNFHYSVYKITDHHRKVEEFCKLMPDSAIVSAEAFLTPRLYKKKGTMVFPQLESLDGKIKADYVFIDKKNPIKTGIGTVPGSWDGLRQNPQYYYDWVEKESETWKLIKSDDGYFLYQRIK